MRHLWIVSREESQLYEYLRNQFGGRPNVGVVVDRRQGQRRQRAESPRSASPSPVFPERPTLASTGAFSYGVKAPARRWGIV